MRGARFSAHRRDGADDVRGRNPGPRRLRSASSPHRAPSATLAHAYSCLAHLVFAWCTYGQFSGQALCNFRGRKKVRWEEQQEGKWEAAAAAVVVAAAATAAGVQARWWVRKGRARQRRRRATAAAAATARAAAAAATVVRSGWAEAAPASLCRRAERVLHSQLRHGGRGLRLGGGGKRGWVT